MRRYVIDIETRSDCDLESCGAWVYSEHPSTRILCVAWCDADTDSPPESWDVTEDPEKWEAAREMLLLADVLIAHNAAFERLCLSRTDDPRWGEARRWKDSAMLAGACGRPRKLRDACRSLCFPEELSKDARGKRLLRMFSARTTKGTLYEPHERPSDFSDLVAYCRQDVVSERAVWRALSPFADELLWDQWLVDCAVDDAGVPIDATEVAGARRLYARIQERAEARCAELTGGVPLRSTPALRKWTAAQGWPLDSFSAASVDAALRDEMMCEAHPTVAEFLRLRKAAAGTAGKKYDAISSMLASDGHCHGILVGRAAHTGRYAGRGLQPQNLPRGNFDKYLLPFVREITQKAATESDLTRLESELEFLAGDATNDALAAILRDCIAPSGDDECLVVSDYSAIEARVLAWLAGEAWVEEIFAGDGKIYERTAAAMYDKAVESVSKHERMAGKIATLALGYGGGVGALQRMAEAYGVEFDDETAQGIVDAWRKARPKTVALWGALDRMINRSVASKTTSGLILAHGAEIACEYVRIAGRPVCRVVLPSGRAISYWDPRPVAVRGRTEIAVEMYGATGDSINIAPEAQGAHFTKTYGGKVAENVTQAVAFDLLLHALLGLHRRGARIAFHVHDEVVVVAKRADAEATARMMAECMTATPPWAKGLVLATEPEVMDRYRK